MEQVEIITKDKVRIVGDYYPVSPLSGGRRGSALLLHMMPANRRSWLKFAERLVGEGVQVLAIDLRGHGDSTKTEDGQVLDYHQFSDEQHKAKRMDVEAAAEWLAGERRAFPGTMIIGGASIGANLALGYAAEEPALAGVFALSPGLNYHGVTTEDKIKQLAPEQAVFLAASEDDTHASWEAIEQLSELRSGIEKREFDHAGHGTEMFEREPELVEDLVKWMRKALSLHSDV